MKKLLLITGLLSSLLAHSAPPTEGPKGYERQLVAWVILAEARGEGRKGMEAVYEVLWKRAHNRKLSLRQVVLEPRQFAPVTGLKERDIPAKLGQRMSKSVHYRWVHDELLKWPPLTLHTVPKGMKKLASNRADHFHSGRPPFWAKGEPSVEIGDHFFYKLR